MGPQPLFTACGADCGANAARFREIDVIEEREDAAPNINACLVRNSADTMTGAFRRHFREWLAFNLNSSTISFGNMAALHN